MQADANQDEHSEPSSLASGERGLVPPNSCSSTESANMQAMAALDAGNERVYDIVIFAASGSVGRFLVEELALVVEKYYSSQQDHATTVNRQSTRELRDPSIQFAQIRRGSVPKPMAGIKWAIAGRSAVKLSEALCRAELSTGIRDLSLQVPCLLADLNHHRSLLDLCSKTKLIINCAGPYIVDGETVIKACLETGTNYVDFAYETTFIERIRQEYSDRARKAGIYVINGCGFQSMSAEMGLNFAKQLVDGQIEEMKIILNLSHSIAARPSGSGTRSKPSGIVTYGMWCSFITEQAQKYIRNSEVRKRSKMNPTESIGDKGPRALHRKDTQSLVRDVVEFRNRKPLDWLQLFKGFDECGRRFCLPIDGVTSEEYQLIMGEMGTYEYMKPDLASIDGWRPIRCTSFISLKSISEIIVLLIWLFIFNILVKFSLARKIMKAFPSISSLGHVSDASQELDRESLSHIKFCQTFLAYGTPGENSGDPLEQRRKDIKRKQEQLLVTRIVGPEPNHIATATYAIQAALTLLLEKDNLPPDGGVFTPGSALADTNIIYQLRRRNIKFEVMKKA